MLKSETNRKNMRELTIKEHNAVMLMRSRSCERNDKGYPLLTDGSVDWELTSWEKEKNENTRTDGFNKKPKRKHASNFTPPKKRNRK